MRSILSLPTVLQEVWSRVYAAVIASPHNANAKRSDAEEQAWEAVRRANGGEMPEDDSALGDDPIGGDSLRKFAVIVASAEYSDGWDELALLTKRARVEAMSRLLENPASSGIARVALAVWKAARCTVVAVRPREEPTVEEMVEALAKIVANAVSPGTDPEVLDLARRSLIEEDVPDLDGDMLAASIAAFQAWKAARAWGRK